METTEVNAVAPISEDPKLSEEQIIAAATNSPALSPEQFTLGDRVFKVVHLPYDDYVLFLGYLQPFLTALATRKSSKVSIPGIDLGATADANSLIRFCSSNLPELVRIVCKQSDPTITIDDIKRLGGNPFVLCGVVFKQLAYNQMIGEFVSFFKQVTPLLAVAK